MKRNFGEERGKTLECSRSERGFAAKLIFRTAALIVLCTVVSFAQESGSTNNEGSGDTKSADTVTVPAGTRMRVRMLDAVDSEKNNANDRFRGVLEVDLKAGDALVAPEGTTVFGRLLTAESAGSRTGGELELDITEIQINGTLHSLMTSSKQVQGAEGSGVGRPAAKGAGAGGVAGAVLGAGVGFGARAGAIIGGISGARARGEKVNVPSGAIVDFTLDHPVSLPKMQH